MDIDLHQQWFEEYAASKIAGAGSDPEPLRIKLEHTRNVVENARQIAAAEGYNSAQRRSSILAAIYHDLSRFDQYLVYGTFKDKDSRNHGAWSVKLLKATRRLADEPDSLRRMIQIAVGMHNRLALPAGIRGDTLITANTVRDADKLDILRVMDRHLAIRPYNPTVILGLPDEPDLAGPAVIAAAIQGRSASYSDLRSVNDFRLLLGTWFYSLNFASSRKLYREAGHGRRLVEGLPDNELYGEARRKLLDDFMSS